MIGRRQTRLESREFSAAWRRDGKIQLHTQVKILANRNCTGALVAPVRLRVNILVNIADRGCANEWRMWFEHSRVGHTRQHYHVGLEMICHPVVRLPIRGASLPFGSAMDASFANETESQVFTLLVPQGQRHAPTLNTEYPLDPFVVAAGHWHVPVGAVLGNGRRSWRSAALPGHPCPQAGTAATY